MTQEQMYLKPNVRIEGLVNQFVAWTHAYTPVTGALNLASLYMPILDSYVQRPEVHEAAVANPKMKGATSSPSPTINSRQGRPSFW